MRPINNIYKMKKNYLLGAFSLAAILLVQNVSGIHISND
jgi:hypothetical protein